MNPACTRACPTQHTLAEDGAVHTVEAVKTLAKMNRDADGARYEIRDALVPIRVEEPRDPKHCPPKDLAPHRHGPTGLEA